MPSVSQVFHLGKTQAELDFVDVALHTDNRLFLDPFAISQRVDRWSQEAHLSITTFFQEVVDRIKSGCDDEALELLLHLREPNETRFGYSKRKPQGAGVGVEQAEQIFDALAASSAVRTGFITALEESELMIQGIGRDKISDLTTNIIRHHLIEYTAGQCDLHGIPRHQVPVAACFNADGMTWEPRYGDLPLYRDKPILLVPKAVVRRAPAYQCGVYYQHFVLNFMQELELANPQSRLVRALKNKKLVVRKKDLRKQYPNSKEFLFEFSKKYPRVLKVYRQHLAELERLGDSAEIEEEDERMIAEALAQALRHIPPGDAHYTEYHRLMIGAVEFLFYPQLLHPRKEREIHEGRKRIDIVMENGANAGLFLNLARIRHIPCAYVPFECKN